jgi:hypothetical protein
MSANLRATANDILNRVAAEVGLEPVNDPYGSSQQEFKQMTYLLNIAGEELCQIYQWEFLMREHKITTQATDSGFYPLPDDFLYMINQTGWERSENVPLYGPLSPQDWQYLLGRDLVSHTIYASFRIQMGTFSIFPQPPPDGLDINFEYICRNWVIDSSSSSGTSASSVTNLTLNDKVKVGADTPLFDRTLLSRMLKVKFLEAKGLDTTKAQADLNQSFQMLTSHDKGADILSAGKNRRGFPYLNGFSSVPDTGYGSY